MKKYIKKIIEIESPLQILLVILKETNLFLCLMSLKAQSQDHKILGICGGIAIKLKASETSFTKYVYLNLLQY